MREEVVRIGKKSKRRRERKIMKESEKAEYSIIIIKQHRHTYIHIHTYIHTYTIAHFSSPDPPLRLPQYP